MEMSRKRDVRTVFKSQFPSGHVITSWMNLSRLLMSMISPSISGYFHIIRRMFGRVEVAYRLVRFPLAVNKMINHCTFEGLPEENAIISTFSRFSFTIRLNPFDLGGVSFGQPTSSDRACLEPFDRLPPMPRAAL
jgi:hypothetical protein